MVTHGRSGAALATALAILGVAVALGLTVGADSALAATCADFPNQAAAQAAANTRDADGDGIYCESLPCPCMKPGNPSPSPAPASPSSPGGGSETKPGSGMCGVERWSVKTLQDPRASSVRRTPRGTSIAAIRKRALVATDGPRQSPFETTTWTVQATVKAAKIEDDSDVHLVIADPTTGGTMIAEIPLASCAPKAPSWATDGMASARDSLAACGAVGTTWLYYPANTTARITGVGFVDRKHGQKGVAPNGAELHPVTALSITCG